MLAAYTTVAFLVAGVVALLAWFLFTTIRERVVAQRLPAYHNTLDTLMARYCAAVGARQGLVLRAYTDADRTRFDSLLVMHDRMSHNMASIHSILAALSGQTGTDTVPEPLAAVETLFDFNPPFEYCARVSAPNDLIASEPIPLHPLHQEALARLVDAVRPKVWGQHLPPPSPRTAILDRGPLSGHQMMDTIAELERLLPASIPLSSLPLDTPFAIDPAP